MNKKEIIKVGFRKKRDAKKTPMLAIFLVVLFMLSTANTYCFLTTHVSSSASTILRSSELEIRAIISEELFVDNFTTILNTGTYPRNSIVHINITVLPQSNACVEILYDGNDDDVSPKLTNFTLAPGGSFAENYTCIIGTICGITYLCHCTLDNSNVTILWWYEVLYSAKPEGFIGIDFPFILGSLIILSLGVIIRSKRKVVEKK
ncbi:MAG: hypothetical protein ACTSPM_06830 [Candidatus Heimdallarchaeota archaeon]